MNGARGVAQEVQLLPAGPAFHTSTSFSPSCSTYKSALYWLSGKAEEDGSKTLGPCHPHRKLGESSWLLAKSLQPFS